MEEHLNTPQEVEVVINRLRRLRRRDAVHKVERPDAGLHLVGRHDLFGNLVVIAGRLVLRVSAGDRERRGERDGDDFCSHYCLWLEFGGGSLIGNLLAHFFSIIRASRQQ